MAGRAGQKIKLTSIDELLCVPETEGTDYMVIYPVDSAVKIDGSNFILGECLIMKSGNGVQCMTQKELEEAFVEFISRTTSVYAGQYELPAYQVDQEEL